MSRAAAATAVGRESEQLRIDCCHLCIRCVSITSEATARRRGRVCLSVAGIIFRIKDFAHIVNGRAVGARSLTFAAGML